MLPFHYTRFSKFAGIGCIEKQRRKTYFENYQEVAEHGYKDSTEDALYAEIVTYEDLVESIFLYMQSMNGAKTRMILLLSQLRKIPTKVLTVFL